MFIPIFTHCFVTSNLNICSSCDVYHFNHLRHHPFPLSFSFPHHFLLQLETFLSLHFPSLSLSPPTFPSSSPSSPFPNLLPLPFLLSHSPLPPHLLLIPLLLYPRFFQSRVSPSLRPFTWAPIATYPTSKHARAWDGYALQHTPGHYNQGRPVTLRNLT